MKRILLVLSILCLMAAPLQAQEGFQLFTNSIDTQTGSISFVWVDVTTGKQTRLASFTSSGNCHPERLGNTFLYEPQTPGGNAEVYQVDLTNGNILPFAAAAEQQLHCPAVNPTGSQITWLQHGEEAQSIVLTDVIGANPVVLATHPSIYDANWSPDGTILTYTAVGDDQTFRQLYAYTDSLTEFWPRDAGLVIDTLWTPDSQTLLIAYYTQDEAIVGTLSQSCVIQGGCAPTPLATFPSEAGLILENAFSPDGSQFIVIQETNDGMGVFNSELMVVDLATGSTRQLVDMPGLIKTSAVWIGDMIYFIGSVFDESTFTMSDSAIYTVSPQGGSPNIAYQADDYLPTQIFWVAQS